MTTAFDKFERFGKKTYQGQDILKNHILEKFPIHYTDNVEDYSVVKQYADQHEFVWLVETGIDVLRSFPWFFKPSAKERDAVHVFPYIYKSSKRVKSWKKVQLVPTRIETEKIVKQNHICGIYDFYNGKTKFDIFYIGEESEQYTNLAERFKNIKRVSSYAQARELSETDMFWVVPDDIDVSPIFKFSYQPDDWSHKFTHVFVNGNSFRDGVILAPKNYEPSAKELKYRYFANKKELNIVASYPKKYPMYYFNNYQEYTAALETEHSDLFWWIPDDVEVENPLVFTTYFEHRNQYDRTSNHVFLNDESYDGIALFSKHSPVTEKEFNHRFYANKKEHEVLASRPKKFDQFVVDNYVDYKLAKQRSKTEMFWCVPSDVNPVFDFSTYFTHHNQYDRNMTHVFLNGETYDGIVLFSKNVEITEKEFEHRFYIQKKEWNIIASTPKPYDVFLIDSYDEYVAALDTSTTDMFWMSSRNISHNNKLLSTYYISHHKTQDKSKTHAFVHQVQNENLYNGLFLCSKQNLLSEREVQYRFPAERIEHDIVGSTGVDYDVFEIDSYDEYLNALENSTTEMFWMSSRNIVAMIPNIYFVHNNEYDRKQNHTFLHCENKRNGLFLMSKHVPVTQREIEHRFLVSAKEWDIVASKEIQYNIFTINNYNDYITALENSVTELFYGVPSDVVVDFDFNLYFTHDNEYDRKINHVFLNGEHSDGVVLFSKHAIATQKEVENRFYVNKKDWDIVASTPKPFDFFNVESYDQYLEAIETSTTEMFWASTANIKINSDFDLTLYFSHHNAYDRNINHTFIHNVNGNNYYNGLFLLTKRALLTEKEIEHRLVANRKEHKIVASGPTMYDQFVINTYDDYEFALRTSKTEMFWMIPPEVNINKDFEFDLYFTHNQWFERETNHVFMNGPAWDGVALISKKSLITEREINMRFLANKKQYDIVASNPTEYDIVFISKDEEHANVNYSNLLERFPRAKRVHGVEGIHAAHIEAAKLCNTDMIWIVDADAEIIDKFAFDYYVPAYDPDSRKTVHVWKSQNPINGLVYGYGAVKLLPRELTLNMDTNKPDMTTSISSLFKSINRISNITKFNTDEFSTWRSAFRECVKLSARAIDGQLDEETEFRLNVWCTRGKDKPFGNAAIHGAIHGKKYGESNRDNLEALRKINDFNWLREQFDELKHSL